MSRAGCIYAICNSRTGEAYIGRTGELRERWKAHRRALEQGTHCNRALQRSWAKHGANAFTLVILERFTGDYYAVTSAMYHGEHRWFNEAMKHHVRLFNDRGMITAATDGARAARRAS